MFNNNYNGNNNNNDGMVAKTVPDDLFGEAIVRVHADEAEAKKDTEESKPTDTAKTKTLSAIQRAKLKLAELQEKQKKELEAIKKLEKAEALKIDKQLAQLIREFHENNFSDFNNFKTKIKEILD